MTSLWTLPPTDAEAILTVASITARMRRVAPQEVQFANDAQRTFFESRAPEVLYSGAMGAGKSRILCEKAWRIAREHPGVTVGVFRKVAASLPATTLRTFQRDVMGPQFIAARNKTEGWYDLTNTSRIYFMGLDPDPLTGVPSKVGSLDLAWAGVDEAVELTESDWIMIVGRLRDPRMPWHQVAAATNPGPPNHWLKRRFTPPTDDRVYLHATAFDNIFLPEDYKTAIAGLPDTAAGRRLGRGEWAAAEGVIYELPPDQVRKPEGTTWRRVVAGLDWGFVHAFACEVIGQSGSGRLAVLDEYYERGKTVDRLIPHLRTMADLWGITTFFADPSEPAYIDQCRRAGLPVEPARNDVDPGIQAVQKAIKAGLTVDPACEGLLGELPGYTWAPNRLGGYHERPIEINDDACDALRYGVMAFEPDPGNPWAYVGQSASSVA
ncbi:MAG TPA: phage terminase large subunit [Candidatus Limnocylindrales bacterium]|nr:phage terminase large subunit [Candidatus Limnocylindrales bacterium]